MIPPIYKYFDPFNDVQSKPSDQYPSLSAFFMEFEQLQDANNNPSLMVNTGRLDKEKTPIYSGDIVRTALSQTTGSAYHGTEETIEGHRIGVVRYQPSKGFVVSRAIECWENENGSLGEYHKIKGAFEFSVSNSKVVGNIHSNDEFYDSILEAIKRRNKNG